MNYWWVNQNETYRQERNGGYMWCPKKNKRVKGYAKSPHYDNMLRVVPGDIVFSFRQRRIPSLGVIQSLAYSASKPTEFGRAGRNWDDDGWRVDVDYRDLRNKIRPVDHMDQIRPTLPTKRAPLQLNGNGKQAYLFHVPEAMANVLLSLIGSESQETIASAEDANDSTHPSAAFSTGAAITEQRIKQDPHLGPTEKTALIKSRLGQGKYRRNVLAFETRCRITGIENPRYLIASHMKPWVQCTNPEKLDGANGLLLSPHVDHLFDSGYISFTDSGDMICSPRVDPIVLDKLHIKPDTNVGPFREEQLPYLAYHREFRLKK
jgi:putative restriction endonuclease